MALIQWNERFSVGVPSLDTQHRQLIDILNELHDAMTNARGKDIQVSIVQRLAKYASTHLETEERMLKTKNYPSFAPHKAQHDAYMLKMKDFEKQIGGDRSVAVGLMSFLKEWWTGHILNTDKQYSDFMKANGAV
jgi:hemerythrin